MQHTLFSVVLAGLLALAPVTAARPDDAGDAPVSRSVRFTASDGVELQTTLTGAGSLTARPTVVEFSPYGRDSGTLEVGPAFNTLLVQVRGTGDSDGRFDALGPRSQQDVAEVLSWACAQPWSDGRLALNGFSASAILLYNSLHLALPCVQAAVLRSGTFELYRDLLVPGGITNLLPGLGVLALIGAPALAQGADRLARDPASSLDVASGLFLAGLNAGLLHPTLDAWWRERGYRGNLNHFPVLVIDGFFDVESRGAFEGYQALRDSGAHLLVVGGHDAAPVGTDRGVPEAQAWLDHYVRGVDNGVEQHPRVRMLLADGDREDMIAGRYDVREASDWPVPGTTWQPLNLDPRRSGGALSLNDGSLTLGEPGPRSTQAYPSLPTLPTNTDPANAAIVGSMGLDALFTGLPLLTDMTVSEALGLTYTTRPLREDLVSAGPLSLELPLATTALETAVWAVLSDVSPDGVAHPLTAGRLLSSFPDVDPGKSRFDAIGQVVQPYGDFSRKSYALPGVRRLYRVELWPVGNRFRAGHRIRVQVVGASAASLLGLPALNTVQVGSGSGARLLLPVLPGSDVEAALG
ncbi:MAG TPA: CocE/NonD family hydrolase [Marmoricola sp.]